MGETLGCRIHGKLWDTKQIVCSRSGPPLRMLEMLDENACII